ncbi:MAG: hypothetical protein ACKO4W_01845, partial [Bacteroidota bacterium]
MRNILFFDALAFVACGAMIWTGNTFASSAPAAEVVPIPLSIKSGDSLVIADVPEVEAIQRNISSRILTEVLPDTL